jgi:hypothetical protein
MCQYIRYSDEKDMDVPDEGIETNRIWGKLARQILQIYLLFEQFSRLKKKEFSWYTDYEKYITKNLVFFGSLYEENYAKESGD